MRSAGESTDVVRINREDARARSSEAAAWLSSFAGTSSSAVRRVSCAELGELTAVFEPIGYYAALGHVIVASRRADFPSPSELVTIRSATSLATTALEAASAMKAREEALRAKDDFLALLGHELRNPLAPIRSALDVLRSREQGQLSREAQIIDRQVEHLTRLVDDLLDIARITRGSIELKPSVFELCEVIEQAVESTATLFESHRHELSVDCPSAGLLVQADRFRLLQVIVNLLTNAARYTPDGGHAKVRAFARGNCVVLSVRDNGIGMEAEFLPRVFDPFVQARRSSGPQYSGLGIGLALVQKIITLHGGRVMARSEGPGRGSEFELELPFAPTERALRAPPGGPSARATPSKSAPQRILVIDDNVDSGEMLGEALSLKGHEAKVLHDPLQAVACAASFRPDIVFIDLNMPVLDGFGVAAELRRHFTEGRPALVALTGYGLDSDRKRTAAAGFDGHLVKPVELQKLLAQVELLRADAPER
jgi:signal transduction histidine kinase/ActR/RegA family two-component response regulator